MKLIFISGITGFVGQNLKKYFDKKSYNVKKINRNDYSYLSDSDVIIHLAGKAHDLKNTSNPQEYYDINTELTKKVFDSFLISDATIFITLSSIKAVADNTEEILTEDFIPNPISHYGKSKRLAEEYILANLPTNKKVYILRPCMIHGEGNKGNLTLLYNFVKKGIPYPLGAYNNNRSFLSIDNLCFIINELIERKDIPSGIYHLADDVPISTQDLILLIGEVLNRKLFIWKTPKFIIKIIAKFGDFLSLPINTERVMKMTENYVVSNQKITNALGKKLPISSEDGLRKTIESFKK